VYELYRVLNPRPGLWTIQLFGAELPPGGEDVTVKVTTALPPDALAPNTEISIGGAAGSNGWYASPVTVTLTAEDNEGGQGVAWTRYSLDEDETWPGSNNDAEASPFVTEFEVSTDFAGEVWARSADRAEPANIEGPVVKHKLKVDVTAPAVAVVEPAGSESVDVQLEAAATATDATSGVAGVYFYIRRANEEQGTPIGHEGLGASFDSAAGQWEYTFDDLSDLTAGDYVILASAEDGAGNEGWSEAVAFSVPSAPTPTPIPTPSPTALPSMSVPLAAGWNDKCYVGTEEGIEGALGGIASKVLGVYRFDSFSQDFDRWFPGRPDLSNMSIVDPYDQLFLLMSAAATWEQEQSTAGQASVSLIQGWNSVCYTGQQKVVAEATAGIAGKFGILYMFGDDQAWARHVPGRSDLSDMTEVEPYYPVLVLITQAGGTQWIFNP
jgi:hypothetical protein